MIVDLQWLLSSENLPITLLEYTLIPFLLFAVFVLVLVLVINHFIYLERKKRLSSIIESTDIMLTDLLFIRGGIEQMRATVEVFKFSVPYNRKWCRDIIMKRILQMKQKFLLDSDTLLNIYKLFEYEKVTYQLLNHKKWYKQALGIYQLQFIHDLSKKKQLNKLLNKNNQQVKSNALITLVTFSPERFGVLFNYTEALTKADEIKILDIIYHNTSELPEHTHLLLKSKNSTIVVLGIKLMVLYKAEFSMNQLNKLIRLSNFRIRKEAIKAVGKLKISKGNSLLLSQYNIERHKKIKINILISIKNLCNVQSIEYLHEQLKTEKDEDILFRLIDALLTIDPYFFKREGNSEYLKDKIIKSISLHVKDPLLA